MDPETIKKIIEEFLEKMTIPFISIEVKSASEQSVIQQAPVVKVAIIVEDPKILIGQGGQTLFELQRILKIILNKKLSQVFYLDIDINDYKAKKEEYLKNLAHETAKEVFLTKKIKTLPPMLAYERRIVHQELQKIDDVISKSEGEGLDRKIVIMPK